MPVLQMKKRVCPHGERDKDRHGEREPARLRQLFKAVDERNRDEQRHHGDKGDAEIRDGIPDPQKRGVRRAREIHGDERQQPHGEHRGRGEVKPVDQHEASCSHAFKHKNKDGEQRENKNAEHQV